MKSTSLYFGDRPQLILGGLSAAALAGFAGAGFVAELTTPFYVCLGAVAGHFGWQVATINVEDRRNLWDRFASNRYVGLAMTGAIIAGHF